MRKMVSMKMEVKRRVVDFSNQACNFLVAACKTNDSVYEVRTIF